ncbi:MAG TPA: outer membrane beta-barrel protein [Alphaproteobacteria bacterium]|nr:outer membrane beta-barrel protein [Alphaproteobacteria bacterium]
MKKLVIVCAVLAAFSIAAGAQDYPKVEVFGGYVFNHYNLDKVGFNLNGGTGSISYNPTQTLGLVADISVYHGNPKFGIAELDTTRVSYLFGPKLAMRSNPKFTPYVHSLFGSVHESVTVKFPGVPSFPAETDNAFGMALGGGVDVKVHNNIAIRVAQVEYVFTKFRDAVDNHQSGVRISTGIVFRFGS